MGHCRTVFLYMPKGLQKLYQNYLLFELFCTQTVLYEGWNNNSVLGKYFLFANIMAPSVIALILDLYFKVNCVAGIYFYLVKPLVLFNIMVMNNRQVRFLNILFKNIVSIPF